MEKRITELVFILDKSGSMEHMRTATVANFNELLDAQKAETHGDEARISVYSFNQALDKVCFRAPLETARPLTEETYVPNGMTALNDAVCAVLNEIAGAQKEELDGGRKIVTVVCIITDGLENASRFYRRADVQKKIAAKKEEGWNFLFAGANFDAEEEGADLGFARRDCIQFEASPHGIRRMTNDVCHRCLSLREEPDDESIPRRSRR